MRLIDRYLFHQLRASTALAAAALTGVALLSQSLSALDLLMDQRQSPWVFLKVTLLATPQLVALVLPVACLVAGLATFHRLHADQEFVTCYSAGMSRWDVLAPFARLACWAALLVLMLTLWVQPLCYRILRETLDEARGDLAGALVRPGQFNHPAPGLTVYAQSLGDDGALRNIFIDQQTDHGGDNTLTARYGRFRRRAGAPVFILHDGSNQSFAAGGAFNYLLFDEYVLDLRTIVRTSRLFEYKPSDRYLHELFYPDPHSSWAAERRRQLLAEGHARLSAPLYVFAFVALAAAAVLSGPHARSGQTPLVAATAAAALIDRTLGFAAEAAAGVDPRLNLLQYAVPLAAVAGGLWLLLRRRGRSRRPAKRPPTTAVAAAA